MRIQGQDYRTIWEKAGSPGLVQIIDQSRLPHEFIIEDLTTVRDFTRAIQEMHVRGAILIGVAAGYGMYLAAREAAKTNYFNDYIRKAGEALKSTRPTAVNLAWAVEKQVKIIQTGKTPDEKILLAGETARAIASEEESACQQIGGHGLRLIQECGRAKKGKTINILTHCNAGWLACVDYGTATAPIYEAFNQGLNLHVWVDETRPWNQGARLTAWELGQHGVPHTVIADNTGGHLMQHGMVDMVIVGSDRTTRRGDVANKIGTYLKALAARDNNVPFYAALPSSSFDWQLSDGLKEIPIEERAGEEVKYISGQCEGKIKRVLLTPPDSPAANYAFDVTPARLITGLITERGVCEASEAGIADLYPGH